MLFKKTFNKPSHYLTYVREGVYHANLYRQDHQDEDKFAAGATEILIGFGIVGNYYYSITKAEAENEIEYELTSCLRSKMREHYPFTVRVQIDEKCMIVDMLGQQDRPLSILRKMIEFLLSEAAYYKVGRIDGKWNNLPMNQSPIAALFSEFGFVVAIVEDTIAFTIPFEGDSLNASMYLRSVKENPQQLLIEGGDYLEVQEIVTLQDRYLHISRFELSKEIKLTLKEKHQEICCLGFRVEDEVIEIIDIHVNHGYSRSLLCFLIQRLLLEAINNEVVYIKGLPYMEREAAKLTTVVFAVYGFKSYFEDNRLILRLVV